MKHLLKIHGPEVEGVKTQKGMTLVEILIVLSIFVIVMVAVAAFEVNIFSYRGSIESTYQTTQSAQIILRTMLSELREAKQGVNGSYAISKIGSTTISFYSDADNDQATELITYTFMGDTLYRAVIKPNGSPSTYSPNNQSTTTLLLHVRNGQSVPLFEFFDSDYNGASSALSYTAPITNIKLVKINISLDVDERKSPVPVTYSVQASFRNLKNNL